MVCTRVTPVNCRVGHHPDIETYGDCVRACVATLLDIADGDKVPHFYHDNPDGRTGHARITEYLATQGYAPFFALLPGDLTLDELLAYQGEQNPTVPYMLVGTTGPGGGDHAVVCVGGRIAHDPNWVPVRFKGPPSTGVWQIMLVVRA